MLSSTTVHLAAVLGATLPWASGRADEVERVYRELFGAEEQRVAASARADDDAAFAAKLLDSAALVSDEPKLQALLYRKAYEFGARSVAGSETAIAAAEGLARLDPSRRTQCREMLAKVYELRYRRFSGKQREAAGGKLLELLVTAGDGCANEANWTEAIEMYTRAGTWAGSMGSRRSAEIAARIRVARQWRELQAEIQQLTVRLLADPAEDETRSALLRLYVVDLDDPAAAQRLLSPSADETYRTYVPLAARDPAAIPPTACRELGAWYHSLAREAGRLGKRRALARARLYYRRFLDAPGAKDAINLKAKLALAQIEQDLKALGSEPIDFRPGAAAAGWTDLLKWVDPARDARGGKWQRTADGLLCLPGEPTKLLVPARPEGSYRLRVRFVPAESDQLAVQLPVGPTACVATVRLAKDSVTAELARVRRPGGTPQPVRGSAKRPGAGPDSAGEHVLEAGVSVAEDRADITVQLDGVPCLRVAGQVADLSPPAGVSEMQRLGIAVPGTRLLLTGIDIRLLWAEPKAPSAPAGR